MTPRKNKRNEDSKAIAQVIIDQYQPTYAEDMHDALRDIFGPMFEAMLQGGMNSHLGYDKNDHGCKETADRRNGYIYKSIRTTMGEVEIDSSRGRDGSFEPQLAPKRSKDVSGIEDKVLAMYARGMSQRDIADTIEDIYGLEMSHETISNITDQVIETALMHVFFCKEY
ncbi:MAG: transposase [Lachnospiraceae bacterium]|nr:transposase [Lachnospiraceae bacterium]